MSGLVADARTLVDHARVETQNHWFTYNEKIQVRNRKATHALQLDKSNKITCNPCQRERKERREERRVEMRGGAKHTITQCTQNPLRIHSLVFADAVGCAEHV